MAKKQAKTKGTKKSSKTTKALAPDAAVPATWPESPKARVRDPRLPAAGSVITRSFKGAEIKVTVLEDGFRYEGKEFRSLTALALQITGYPAISGPAFFRLTGTKTAAETPADAPKWKRPAKAAMAPTDVAPAAESATA